MNFAANSSVNSPQFSADDHRHMARALQLAERGLWTTSPNPRVGCVLVKDGHLIAEGWHEKAGGPHAEVVAIAAAKAADKDVSGATAYVTLEPCNFFGRTPPCADALIAADVKRVVVAMADPNPQVAGGGLAKLRAAGIEVASGLLESAARELNAGFVSRMTRGRPHVRVKLAASLDGRTALAGGESQWITGPDARRDTHRWRARACAVLTGSGTVLADDPQMNVREVFNTPRLGEGEPAPALNQNIGALRQPLRVVVDSAGRIAPQARVFRGGALWVRAADQARSPLLPDAVECLCLPGSSGHVDLSALLQALGQRGINELHVEAGPKLSGALLSAGLVDELLLYLAPCLIGDTGRGLFSMPGLESLADRPELKITDMRMIGQDLRVLARLS